MVGTVGTVQAFHLLRERGGILWNEDKLKLRIPQGRAIFGMDEDNALLEWNEDKLYLEWNEDKLYLEWNEDNEFLEWNED